MRARFEALPGMASWQGFCLLARFFLEAEYLLDYNITQDLCNCSGQEVKICEDLKLLDFCEMTMVQSFTMPVSTQEKQEGWPFGENERL